MSNIKNEEEERRRRESITAMERERESKQRIISQLKAFNEEKKRLVGELKKTNDLERQQLKVQKDTEEQFARAAKGESGTIRRLGATLGVLSTVDATYHTMARHQRSAPRESWLDDRKHDAALTATFAKTYARSVTENLKTALTGKDFSAHQKTGRDILIDLKGHKPGFATTSAGLAMDIGMDPLTYAGGVAAKGVLALAAKTSTSLGSVVKKAPAIEKGIDALKARFNIFAGLDKTMAAADLEKFKHAFRVAEGSGNFDELRKMGLRVSQFAGAGGPTTNQILARGTGGQLLSRPVSDKLNSVLSEAFSPRQTSAFGKIADVPVSFYKGLMQWSPRFQIRNFVDAVSKNFGEMGGKAFPAYAKAAELMWTKSGKASQGQDKLYQELLKQGSLGSTGMAGTSTAGLIKGFPARIAQLGESWNRTALAIGKFTDPKSPAFRSAEKAVDFTQSTHFRFGSVGMTAFEKNFMARLMPFYSFQKGQAGYWPEALARNSRFYNNLTKVKKGTESDSDRDHSEMTPGWQKDMFMFGDKGNVGFSLEDFLGMASLRSQRWFSQLTPLKAALEAATDYGVMSGKPISENVDGRKYANTHAPVKFLMGYNESNQTLNPWVKHSVESSIGILTAHYLDAMNGHLERAFFSFRPYDTSYDSKLQNERMERMRTGGSEMGGPGGVAQVLKTFLPGWLFGPSPASAAPVIPAAPPRDFNLRGAPEFANKYSQQYVREVEKEKKFESGFFGESWQPKQPEITTLFNMHTNLSKEIVRAMLQSGPDIGKNFAMGMDKELTILKQSAHWFGLPAEEKKLLEDMHKARTAWLTPKEIGKAAHFSPENAQFRKMIHGAPEAIAYNKAVEEKDSFKSKIGETWRAASGSSYEAIARGLQAEISGVKSKMGTQFGMISQADATNMINALQAQAMKAMDDLDAKSRVAVGNLYATAARAQVDGVEKIELERRAAIEKYHGTDDAKLARSMKNFQQMKMAEELINTEFERKKQDRLVKEAKDHMDYIKSVTKGEAQAIIAALDEIYKRGGMSISAYFDQKLAATTAASTKNMVAALEQLATAVKPRDPGVSTEEINKTKPERVPLETTGTGKRNQTRQDRQASFVTRQPPVPSWGSEDPSTPLPAIELPTQPLVDEAKLLADVASKLSIPGLSLETQVRIIEKALVDITGWVQTGRIPLDQARQAMGILTNEANQLKEDAAKAKEDAAKARLQLEAAVSEIKYETAQLQFSTYSKFGEKRAFNFSEQKADSPFAPRGYDADKERLRLSLLMHDEKNAGSIAKNMQQPGMSFFRQKELGESARDYSTAAMSSFDEQLSEGRPSSDRITDGNYVESDAEWETRLAAEEEGQNSLKAIRDQAMEKERERNAIIVQADRDTWQTRLNTAGSMASGLKDIASQLYEASGRQSKEAFYAMKAAAFAEATIKGAQAIASAYQSGNPYLGAAYAAIIAAQVGVQLGIIAATAIAGPQGKAEGGVITGGSGTRDDVPIMAMGGEYVIRKSSVNRYGASFMDALNKGLVPMSDLNFSVPSLPIQDATKRSFEDGGQVMAADLNPAQHEGAQDLQIINVIDPKLLDKYVAGADGQKTILNVMAANSYEIKRMLR